MEGDGRRGCTCPREMWGGSGEIRGDQGRSWRTCPHEESSKACNQFWQRDCRPEPSGGLGVQPSGLLAAEVRREGRAGGGGLAEVARCHVPTLPDRVRMLSSLMIRVAGSSEGRGGRRHVGRRKGGGRLERLRRVRGLQGVRALWRARGQRGRDGGVHSILDGRHVVAMCVGVSVRHRPLRRMPFTAHCGVRIQGGGAMHVRLRRRHRGEHRRARLLVVVLWRLVNADVIIVAHALSVPTIRLRFEEPLATILEPDLHRARRHLELHRERLPPIKAGKRVPICTPFRTVGDGCECATCNALGARTHRSVS